MFCHITANWRERPLVSRQLVVNRIGNTTTDSGLRIRAALDENAYSSGIKLSEEELASLDIERDQFHGVVVETGCRVEMWRGSIRSGFTDVLRAGKGSTFSGKTMSC